MVDYNPVDLLQVYGYMFEEKQHLLDQFPQCVNFDIGPDNRIILCSSFSDPVCSLDTILKLFKQVKGDPKGCIVRLTQEQHATFQMVSNFYSHIKINKNSGDFTFCNLSKLAFIRKLLFYKPSKEDKEFIKELRDYVPPRTNFSTSGKRLLYISASMHSNTEKLNSLIGCIGRYNATNQSCYVAIPTKYVAQIDRIEDEYCNYTCCLF